MCYNRARCIVVVTQGIRWRLEQRGFGGKVTVIPNGANTKLFRPDRESGAALKAQLDLVDRFLVIYAGIHGVAQGLETVFEAAQCLQAEAPDIHFLFVGEGPKKAELLALRNRLGLTNVTMMAEQPRALMPAYLSAADVALVPLRRLDLFQGALPSKMFDAWACGCPVLLSIAGEARELLEQADAGVFVEPEDAGQMAQALQELKNDPDRLRRYRENGPRFVDAHFSRQRLAAQLETLLVNTLACSQQRSGVARD